VGGQRKSVLSGNVQVKKVERVRARRWRKMVTRRQVDEMGNMSTHI
jgi:hypothetical protein